MILTLANGESERYFEYRVKGREIWRGRMRRVLIIVSSIVLINTIWQWQIATKNLWIFPVIWILGGAAWLTGIIWSVYAWKHPKPARYCLRSDNGQMMFFDEDLRPVESNTKNETEVG